MKRTILLGLLCLMTAPMAHAAGTFRNPMLWADVPDPDVIRVGDDFYLVSTTMHLMPGAPIMKSKDLVNWKTVGYIFDRLTDTPNYDLNGCTAYGRGQWATSLKYHNGRFYALFSPNDKPYKAYIYTAEKAEGPWTLVSRPRHFHDSSLLFDDDGRVYVFSGTGHLTELNADLSDVKQGGMDMQIFDRDSTETGLLEGSRAIKQDGKYYLLMVSWPAGKPRRQVCYRADKITGPYEKRVILESEFGGFSYVGQGTIVDAPDGRWYGVIFQDRGGVGRVLTLMPCTWKDGWPMLGDKEGRVPTVMDKPVQGFSGGAIVGSDDFNATTLGLNWQWNHNPVNTAWSLKERKGWLRLKTCRIVNSLFEAPNTISQRMEGPGCSGSVLLDLSHMKDGDVCGVSAFNGDAGVLSVIKSGKKMFLAMTESSVSLRDSDKAITGITDKEQAHVELKGKKVYLKINADFRPQRDIATFYYSLDGKEWQKIGSDFKMRFDYTRLFMGTRYAIFNYATKQLGGYVDVDFFKYDKESDQTATPLSTATPFAW